MKRFLLTLVCCSPLLFSPSSSFSLNLVGPSDEQVVSFEQYGPISEVETLWRIATKLKPDNSVSVQQTLVAIYKLNPDSFHQGNINKLVPNSILQVPSLPFIQQQTNQQATVLINKYSTPQQTKAPKVTSKVTAKPKPAPIEQKAVVETGPVEPAATENLVAQEEFVALQNELKELRNEFETVNEQLLVETENNQSLKLRLQPLYDQVAGLQEQLENEQLVHVQLQKTINDYQTQLDAVEERPFSGEGLLNEVLRWVTSSLANLLIVMLSPVLLLLSIVVVVMRVNSQRELAAQEQELAESTTTLMEESGQFDSLLTEDLLDEQEVDFASDDSHEENIAQQEPISEEKSTKLDDEIECIDLTEIETAADKQDETLQAAEEDPFAITEVAEENKPVIQAPETDVDDPFGISALTEELQTDNNEDDPFGIAALAEEPPAAADEDDPFGIAALAEQEDLISNVVLDESKPVSEAQQADLDLAAQWESQLSEQADDVQDEKDNFVDLDELTDANIADNATETEQEINLSAVQSDNEQAETVDNNAEQEIVQSEEIDLSHAEPVTDINEIDRSTVADIEEQQTNLNTVEEEAVALDYNEQINEAVLADLSEDPESGESGNEDPDEILAKQLSNVAFNDDVPLPKIDKEEESGFIDIDTLLESSSEESREEPYSEFDLDLGLDEFPDVINSEEQVAINEDDNKVATQLDLARAYLEIDDKAGAKEILLSVLDESNGSQRAEIEKLLSKLQ